MMDVCQKVSSRVPGEHLAVQPKKQSEGRAEKFCTPSRTENLFLVQEHFRIQIHFSHKRLSMRTSLPFANARPALQGNLIDAPYVL